jgi:hypothetical protein
MSTIGCRAFAPIRLRSRQTMPRLSGVGPVPYGRALIFALESSISLPRAPGAKLTAESGAPPAAANRITIIER